MSRVQYTHIKWKELEKVYVEGQPDQQSGC